jgi:type IV pilus assembly protein PilP
MVGTVNLNSNLWGLIQANDGTIHRVRNGNYIGKHHGKIIRIMEDQVELLEIISDGPGAWRERQAAVKLSE